jgi:hypothetical protein
MRTIHCALICIVAVFGGTSAKAACVPFTGSCGGPGQISCSQANETYRGCLLREKPPIVGVGSVSPDSRPPMPKPFVQPQSFPAPQGKGGKCPDGGNGAGGVCSAQ